MSFWNELKRRNVVKVGATYLIFVWLVAQVVSVLAEPLRLPGWLDTVVVTLLAIGFPFALLLAWAYEVTPEGIRPTVAVDRSRSVTHITGQRLNYVVSTLLALALVLLVIDRYVLSEPESAPVAVDPAQLAAGGPVSPVGPGSIIVIPFDNTSSDTEQEHFVDGLSDALMQQLGEIEGLRVTGRTTSFALKGTTQTAAEIRERLGVSYMLAGGVAKSGDRLRVSVDLTRTGDDVRLWGDTYDRELGEIFVTQDEIAREVAAAIKGTLGITDRVSLVGGTDDVEAYELYLEATSRGRGILRFAEIDRSLELLDRAVEIDPDFALAWAQKAEAHRRLKLDASRDGEALQEAAENAALRAVALAPDSSFSRHTLARVASARGDWREAEARYQEVVAALGPGGVGGYGLLKLVVGQLETGRELLLAEQLDDPLNDSTIGFLIAAHDALGDREAALATYERGAAIFGGLTAGRINMTFTLLGRPEFDPREIEWLEFPPGLLASWDDASAAAAELRANHDSLDSAPAWDRVLDLTTGSALAARFSDAEFAMTLFEEALDLSPEQLYLIWRPVFRDVRALPRFKAVARENGLVAYWQQYGWPDLCRPLGDADFQCR